MNRRVVITGLGVICSLGKNMATVWENLLAGKSGIDWIRRFDATQVSSRIAGEIRDFDPTSVLSPKEVRRTDRFIHLAVHAAIDAVRDAGLDLDKIDPERVGVLIGSGVGGMTWIEEQAFTLFSRGAKKMSPFTIPNIIGNMASGYVAMVLGLKGPNFGICSACATGNHAIGEAVRLIKYGDADIFLAGGSEAAITVLAFGGFCAMRALSTRSDDPTKASRPFDKDRDGFVMAEGSSILVLEELESAKRRSAIIYGELIGYGATADAHHVSAPSPNGEGASRCMRMALKNAHLNPDQIDYINAHGTSTQLNDRYETIAVKSVLGDRAKKVPMSSTKSMTGHLLGSAGALETAICVKILVEQKIPPTINYETPDPDCDLDYVPNEARSANVNVVMNNGFGFGGHNATLIARKI